MQSSWQPYEIGIWANSAHAGMRYSSFCARAPLRPPPESGVLLSAQAIQPLQPVLLIANQPGILGKDFIGFGKVRPSLLVAPKQHQAFRNLLKYVAIGLAEITPGDLQFFLGMQA